MTTPSYPEVGASVTWPLPAGYDHLHERRRLGGPLRLTAPCVVTWMVDDPDRAGFAYGTLRGHPECGEEAFVLDRSAAGTWFTISAFSRPATWYARLGAPVTRLVQRRILSIYTASLDT